MTATIDFPESIDEHVCLECVRRFNVDHTMIVKRVIQVDSNKAFAPQVIRCEHAVPSFYYEASLSPFTVSPATASTLVRCESASFADHKGHRCHFFIGQCPDCAKVHVLYRQ